MPGFLDLAGQRFGRLVCVDLATRTPSTAWRCRCDCGKTCTVRTSALRNRRTKSCGCYQREIRPTLTRTHGMARHTPEYRAWEHAKARCSNPTDKNYPHYGGRGITMCAAWRDDFAAFFRDMGPRPDGCSLDRIDNDGHYEPGNCRWATATGQLNNRRNNVTATIDGVTRTIAEWCRHLGLPDKAVRQRLYRGESPERALRPLH